MIQAGMSTATMRFDTRKITDSFGLEILNIDLSNELPARNYSAHL
jgi:hypothetical protein